MYTEFYFHFHFHRHLHIQVDHWNREGSIEIVTIGLTNFGQNPQSLFEYYFAVNGQLAPVSPPSDGFFTGVVGNDSTIFVDFELTWDFSTPGFPAPDWLRCTQSL